MHGTDGANTQRRENWPQERIFMADKFRQVITGWLECSTIPDRDGAKRRLSLVAGVTALLAVAAGAPAFAQTAPSPPSVTVSAPMQKEIVEWQQFTGQFAAID